MDSIAISRMDTEVPYEESCMAPARVVLAFQTSETLTGAHAFLQDTAKRRFELQWLCYASDSTHEVARHLTRSRP